MQKSNIKSFLDSVPNSTNITVKTNENYIFDTLTGVMSFDFDNEILYVLRTNVDVYTQSQNKPIEVLMIEFDDIIHMQAIVSYDDGKAFYEKFMEGKTFNNRTLANIGSYAISSNFAPATGGKYVKPETAIIDANSKKVIYDPEDSNTESED